jgi:hypothetical protein
MGSGRKPKNHRTLIGAGSESLKMERLKSDSNRIQEEHSLAAGISPRAHKPPMMIGSGYNQSVNRNSVGRFRGRDNSEDSIAVRIRGRNNLTHTQKGSVTKTNKEVIKFQERKKEIKQCN